LGAREHYAIPRALQQLGLLDELITDLWARPGSLIRLRKNGVRERYHPGLANAQVRAANLGALAFELTSRTRGLDGWKLITKRNDWFQRFSVAQLSRRPRSMDRGSCTLFAYSYTARRIFELARGRGWRTVLGQIDAGPPEERKIEKARSHFSQSRREWESAPQAYWDEWRLECELADQIVVNSDWSRDALISEGIPAEKLRTIPLALETPVDAEAFNRSYPAKFSAERPLRVLFLGQIGLRKGIPFLLESIKLLRDEPIEFWFVGPLQVEIPPELTQSPLVKLFGPVARNAVSEFYRKADVFIFPTLSDGFGLTQLEAQCWKLPILASAYCGKVVRHGENGLLLEEISANAIADTLRRLVRSPRELQLMAAASGISEPFSLRSLATSLLSL